MSHHMPERDPDSELEDEGIPDLADSTPERKLAADPQGPSVPGDQPVAVDDFGTTAAEQAAGEPLDQRVDREVPEDQAMYGGGPEPVRQPAAATEEPPDRSDDLDAVTADSGLGVGSDLDTEYEPSGNADDPGHAGRLVAPDEGAHPSEEPDAIAGEAGPDSGGYTAEESAMRVEEEEPDDG
jgi:Family of unknown function (DUF5709)